MFLCQGFSEMTLNEPILESVKGKLERVRRAYQLLNVVHMMTGKTILYWGQWPNNDWTYLVIQVIRFEKNLSCQFSETSITTHNPTSLCSSTEISFCSLPGKRRWVRVPLFPHPMCLVPRHRTQPRTGPLYYLSAPQPCRSICNTNRNVNFQYI